MLRSITGVFLFLILSVPVLSQQSAIRGKVVDKSGGPVVAVNISIAGTSRGTVSNNEGAYFLEVDPGEIEVVFTHVKYESVRNNLTIVTGETKTLDITLTEKVEVLDQVEVTGEREREQVSLIRIDPKQARQL